MVNFIFFIYFWPSLFTLLKIYYNPQNIIASDNKKKLVRHYISSTNLILLLTFCPAYLLTKNEIFYDLSLQTSVSYFIWDLYYMFIKDTKEYGYIFHHLSGFLLWNNTLIDNRFKIPVVILYSLSELSNIPMFIIYYLLKTTDIRDIANFQKVLYWKFIQVITYGPIRLMLLPYLLQKYYFKMPNISIIANSLMYLLLTYYQVNLMLVYKKDRLQYFTMLKSE